MYYAATEDDVIRCHLCKTKEDSDEWKSKHTIAALVDDTTIIKKHRAKRLSTG